MTDSNDKNMELLRTEIRKFKNNQEKVIRQILMENYCQLESLSWLQRSLKLKNPLPPLRGWPASPDFLLTLHSWILKNHPKVVVETGSGATTLVIADALRQNGFGKLYSLEHLPEYADKTTGLLSDEYLNPWVELRLLRLEPWDKKHLNLDSEEKAEWYSSMLDDIHNIDLLIVDGPPEGTCRYARYPAVPAFYDSLSPSAEIWMDDASRADEKEICQSWANEFGLKLEFYSLEKGLGVLKRD